MITAAGRAGDPELAYELYRSAKQQYRDALHIDNALLSSVCRHAPLTEVRRVHEGCTSDAEAKCVNTPVALFPPCSLHKCLAVL